MFYIEILVVLSILPIIFMGYYIYINDKVEKESTGLLTKLFLGGILAMVMTFLSTLIILFYLPNYSSTSDLNLIELIPYCFLFVGLIEEGSKWLVLNAFIWKEKEFNYLYDAIVYAVFVSLGFALLENILYVLDGGITIALTRMIFSIPGHTFFGVFMGYYYGIAKKAEIEGNIYLKRKNLFLSILIPILIHGTFDYLLFSMKPILIVIYFIFIIILYVKGIKKIKEIGGIKTSLFINKAIFCPNCGIKLTSNYCPKCGYKK